MLKTIFEFIDEKQIQSAEKLDKKFTANTIGIKSNILGAIIVKDKQEVIKILQTCKDHKIAIYPISSGKNWGYGSAIPPYQKSVILDLSNLKEISYYDHEVGTITIEPGVTQQNLYDFLAKHGNLHMVPTTGAGPHASVLGNACERGYGITPDTDHFNSIYEMEVLLPDGNIIHTGFTNYGSDLLKGIFKTPPGASLNGIFTQSSFGIVLSMTIRLEKRPENISIFSFKIKGDAKLERSVEFIREFRQDMGSLVGGINLMNKERTDAMISKVFKGSVAENNEFEWQIFGGIYGTNETVKAVKKEIKRRIRKYKIARYAIFVGPENLRLIKAIAKLTSSFSFLKNAEAFLNQALEGYEILTGKPNQVALPLAYLGIDKVPDKRETLDPAKDGCGLFWFAPLFPCKASVVLEFCNGVKRVCMKHNILPLITLTTVNHSCIDSTIPILFNPQDKASLNNAKACYDDLMDLARSMKILPYRLSSSKMNEFFHEHQDSPTVKFIGKLKMHLDENEILSVGRYYHKKNPFKPRPH